MKRLVISVVVLLFSYFSFSQLTIEQIQGMIPALQYDDDFMEYASLAMLDGFEKIKEVKGYMKFYKGQKVYAVEKLRYKGGQVAEKVTYFYLKSTPMAISIEKKGKTKVYFLSNGQVIGSLEFLNSGYKPYGSRKLNIKNFQLDSKPSQPPKKYLEESQTILNNLKDATKEILNFRF